MPLPTAITREWLKNPQVDLTPKIVADYIGIGPKTGTPPEGVVALIESVAADRTSEAYQLSFFGHTGYATHVEGTWNIVEGETIPIGTVALVLNPSTGFGPQLYIWTGLLTYLGTEGEDYLVSSPPPYGWQLLGAQPAVINASYRSNAVYSSQDRNGTVAIVGPTPTGIGFEDVPDGIARFKGIPPGYTAAEVAAWTTDDWMTLAWEYVPKQLIQVGTLAVVARDLTNSPEVKPYLTVWSGVDWQPLHYPYGAEGVIALDEGSSSGSKSTGYEHIAATTEKSGFMSTDMVQQLGAYSGYVQTTDATATTVVSSDVMTGSVGFQTAYLLEAIVVGVKTNGTHYASYTAQTCLIIDNTSFVFATPAIVDTNSGDSWGQPSFNSGGGAIIVKVTGKAATTIKWRAALRILKSIRTDATT